MSSITTSATFLLLTAVFVPGPVSAGGDAARGRVLFALAGGCGCHTPQDGPVGAGGGKIATPFGTFFGTNITPDPTFGIGAWSDDEIEEAIRGGNVRGRGAEAPVMPYYLYSGMADTDVSDLIAYLRALPPAARPNQVHEGELPLARLAYRAWRLLFTSTIVPMSTPPASGVERGRYLAEHVSICGDCHTPRNRFGAPQASLHLAGTLHGPGDEKVSNITPHATGIGDWDEDDIVALLREGRLPNFDNVQGMMADVVDGHGGGPGYKDAPNDALRDIARYVRSVPPIDNPIDGN